jgi:hypothetical protein
MSCKKIALAWHFIQSVVKLEFRLELFELFPEQDILNCFIGEKEYQLDFFTFHCYYLSDGLVAGSDACAASDEKQPVFLKLFSIQLHSAAWEVVELSNWAFDVDVVTDFQFLEVRGHFSSLGFLLEGVGAIDFD